MQALKRLIVVMLSFSLLPLTGCATQSLQHPVADPWEKYNRTMYKFNDTLDRYALKPVAEGYKFVTPDFLEKGISNFFSNLGDITVTINDLLQGKFKQAGRDSWRFVMNTTFGLGGFFDVATTMGLPKNNEDFGQTLGKWGVSEGPYVVLPFLGPSTVRSTAGRLVDRQTNPVAYVNPTEVSYALTAVDLIDTRAKLLESSKLLDTVFDPYSFLRDAYVKSRRDLAYDGIFPDDKADADQDLNPDALDELDELDLLDELEELDEPADFDELDELDQLEELERLDNPDTIE